MIVDLHTHTSASDGALSAPQLLQLAADHGVALLAITDHDTLRGWQEAQRYLQQTSQADLPRLLSGVEVSSQWGGRAIHIVGLAVNAACTELQAFLTAQQQRRVTRNTIIAERLARAIGFDISPYLPRELKASNLGRPDFARALVAAGVVKDEKQAFKRFLSDSKLAGLASDWPAMVDVVALLHRNGACPVLAHPMHYKMTATRRRELVKAFAAAGGEALEVVSGQQNSAQTRESQRLANSFGLLASSGSDFHKAGAAWRSLGGQTPLPADSRPLWQHDERFA